MIFAITDSESQVNTKVVGECPSMAMGNLYMTTAQALGQIMPYLLSSRRELQSRLQQYRASIDY